VVRIPREKKQFLFREYKMVVNMLEYLSVEFKGWKCSVEGFLEEGLLALEVFTWSSYCVFNIASIQCKPVSGCFVQELRRSTLVWALVSSLPTSL